MGKYSLKINTFISLEVKWNTGSQKMHEANSI